MQILSTLTTSAVALLISSSVWAQSGVQGSGQSTMPNGAPMDPVMMQNMINMRQQQMQQDSQAGRPVMGGANDSRMMDPVMMQNMMRMRQQQMGQGANMPMMGGAGNREMMMDPMMRQNMMEKRQQMMGQGMHGGRMNPQMMQGMMQMRQQHMDNMDQRLSRIEALLAELVAQQRRAE